MILFTMNTFVQYHIKTKWTEIQLVDLIYNLLVKLSSPTLFQKILLDQIKMLSYLVKESKTLCDLTGLTSTVFD